LAEFLPNSHRGIFLIYVEVFWTIGSMFVAGVAWICLSSMGWRVLALITAIPVALATIGCILLLPESPRWLIVKGRLDEAKQVLITAARVNGQTLDENFILSANIVAEKHASITDFLSPDQRNISLPLWAIWICFGFTYYGIILFIGRLFETDSVHGDLVCHFNYRPIFVSAMSEIFGVIFTGTIIDSWGRVATQASLYAGSGIGLIMMGIGLPDLPLIVVSMCSRLCMMGANSATWVMTPELFQTELRASGHAIANCMARLGAFAVPFLISSHHVDELVVSICLAIPCAIACVCVLMLPETSNKNMDDQSINPGRIQRILDRANRKTMSGSLDGSVSNHNGSHQQSQSEEEEEEEKEVSEEHDRVHLNLNKL
jgi:MFS transporter, putative metabolite:H+ symporter